MEKNLLTLVTGGARSGKSSFGESILKDIDGQILYIATAQAFDDEMKDRIKKHRESRPKNWVTLEGYKNLAEEVQSYKGKIAGIFLDCITIMVTNLMFEEPIDWDIVSMDEVNRAEKNILEEIKNLTLTLKNFHVPVVFITNEIGLGIVPENKIARIFRDIAGRVNQYIGKEVSNVYFVTCGIANKIK